MKLPFKGERNLSFSFLVIESVVPAIMKITHNLLLNETSEKFDILLLFQRS